MNCPYCAERVSDDAIVCKHCHRELFLIRPLMAKLAEANRRLDGLEAVDAPEQAGAHALRGSPWFLAADTDPLSALSLLFIALMLAHFILILEYNLPLVWLRAASILLPLASDSCLRRSMTVPWLVEFVCGVAIARVSILAMAAVVGRLDHVPLLPQDRYEWREFAEYGASIAFGFFTGVIIRHTVIAIYSPAVEIQNWLFVMAWRTVAKRADGKVAGVDLKRVGPIVRTVAAIASAIVSVTTGFKQSFERLEEITCAESFSALGSLPSRSSPCRRRARTPRC